MSTLGEFSEYDDWLQWQMEAQRYKLRANAVKGFLGDKDPAYLLEKLREEIVELEDAVKRGNRLDMVMEAADVANFALALVIAAVKPRNEKQGEQEPMRPALPMFSTGKVSRHGL